jgi:taurine transport system permease protein
VRINLDFMQAQNTLRKYSLKVLDQASQTLWFLAPFLALLLVWVLAITVTGIPERIFPSPGAVWQAAVQMIGDGTLWRHTWASIQRVAIGSLFAIALGIPFGIIMGINRYVADFFNPLLRFSVSLAGIAWIPLATLWFGYGHGTVIFIIFNAVFFSLVYSTVLGVSSIPSDFYRAASSLGANRISMILEVVIPGAMPQIVTGLRVGLGFAWRGLFAAEMIATNLGLGYLLFLSREFYETNKIILSMIVIGILWLLMDRMFLAPLEVRTIQRWGMVRGTK